MSGKILKYMDNNITYEISDSFRKTIIKAFINDEYVGWLVLYNSYSTQSEIGKFMPIHSGNILPNYRRLGIYSNLIQKGSIVAKNKGYDGIISTQYDEFDSNKERSDDAYNFWENMLTKYNNIIKDEFFSSFIVK